MAIAPRLCVFAVPRSAVFRSVSALSTAFWASRRLDIALLERRTSRRTAGPAGVRRPPRIHPRLDGAVSTGVLPVPLPLPCTVSPNLAGAPDKGQSGGVTNDSTRLAMRRLRRAMARSRLLGSKAKSATSRSCVPCPCRPEAAGGGHAPRLSPPAARCSEPAPCTTPPAAAPHPGVPRHRRSSDRESQGFRPVSAPGVVTELTLVREWIVPSAVGAVEPLG